MNTVPTSQGLGEAATPIYVYGLLSPEEVPPVDELGSGIADAAVRTLDGGDLVALVSAAPALDEPIEPTRRNMLLHTKMLERAMARASVLPVRFGTVAPDPAALRRCLATYGPKLRAALAGVAGLVEIGVKASWRDGVVFEEIIAADPALRALRDRLRSRPASEIYYERIELGRRVEDALAARREAETATILAALAPLAERSAVLRTLHETMILNQAFLVKREQERGFDAAMARLADQLGDRMAFRYVGPVPPYNFVSVRTEWLAAA